MSDAGRRADHTSGKTVLDVFFATNRTQRTNDDFDCESADRLRFGVCRVSVPADHTIGNVERPAVRRTLLDPADTSQRIVTDRVTALEQTAFHERVQEHAAPGALIFVHGFNVAFRDAIWRAAQLKNDLQFAGAMIVFSWPSAGDIRAYLQDQESIDTSGDHLYQFLRDLIDATSHASYAIDILAHSLGNRAVVGALHMMSLATARIPAPLRHIVLAAPDIETHLFRQRAGNVMTMARSVTMYVAANDWALRASQNLHRWPRAGDCRDTVVVIPGLATIDVSAVNTGFLGHSFITSNRAILSDLAALLGGAPPPRFGMRPTSHRDGTYWRMIR